jgi:hypothetical protein
VPAFRLSKHDAEPWACHDPRCTHICGRELHLPALLRELASRLVHADRTQTRAAGKYKRACSAVRLERPYGSGGRRHPAICEMPAIRPAIDSPDKHFVTGIALVRCHSCKDLSVWTSRSLAWPPSRRTRVASESLPPDIHRDFEEADAIFATSPRSPRRSTRCIGHSRKGRTEMARAFRRVPSRPT